MVLTKCRSQVVLPLFYGFQLAWPQLANPTKIPAEAKATPVFLLPTTCTCSTFIQDSVPKLNIDFLSNHCSDLDKI